MPLTDTDLHAAGFTRPLLLQEGAAFRADYQGMQVIGWLTTSLDYEGDCPVIVADVIAPRPHGRPDREWPEGLWSEAVADKTVAFYAFADLPHVTDRTKLGTSRGYERTDEETRRAWEEAQAAEDARDVAKAQEVLAKIESGETRLVAGEELSERLAAIREPAPLRVEKGARVLIPNGEHVLQLVRVIDISAGGNLLCTAPSIDTPDNAIRVEYPRLVPVPFWVRPTAVVEVLPA